MDSYGGKLNKLVVHVVRMVHPIISQSFCGNTPSLSKRTQKPSLCVSVAAKSDSKYK